MRLLGHPVHVMLIHFPVALWPAHWGFHLLAGRLPVGLAGAAGFWLLVAGTGLGWLAAACGGMDLIALSQGEDRRMVTGAWQHGLVNGTVLLGFTVLLGLELPRYPQVTHGPAFLAVEAALLAVLTVGNYLGGRLVWAARPAPSADLT